MGVENARFQGIVYGESFWKYIVAYYEYFTELHQFQKH